MSEHTNVTHTSRSTGRIHLTRSGLTGTIYVVTKWKDRGNGNIEAVEKFDVTDQFNRLAIPAQCPECDLDHPWACVECGETL